jgi:hypothetical protein
MGSGKASVHRLVQFHAISRPAVPAPTGPAPWNGELPESSLSTPARRILLVCLWDGYGWLYGSPSVAIMGRRGSIPVPPAFPAEVLDGPRVRLPSRDYLLFAGSLAAAPELGWASPGGGFFPQSPNLFWPQDQAWCVASEIDLFCTLVAGSEALAQALVDNPRLEAWRVQPADPIAFDSDQINT